MTPPPVRPAPHPRPPCPQALQVSGPAAAWNPASDHGPHQQVSRRRGGCRTCARCRCRTRCRTRYRRGPRSNAALEIQSLFSEPYCWSESTMTSRPLAPPARAEDEAPAGLPGLALAPYWWSAAVAAAPDGGASSTQAERVRREIELSGLALGPFVVASHGWLSLPAGESVSCSSRMLGSTPGPTSSTRSSTRTPRGARMNRSPSWRNSTATRGVSRGVTRFVAMFSSRTAW